jgi:hypothetical protein
MTPPEIQAKREWRTGARQVRGCGARPLPGAGDPGGHVFRCRGVWQYGCPKHAPDFAARHGLELPAAPDA